MKAKISAEFLNMNRTPRVIEFFDHRAEFDICQVYSGLTFESNRSG